jgi:ketosteroid isomerase-like protein
VSDDRALIRAANRRFYEALESADADAMRAVWSTEGLVTLVHPGCTAMLGWDDVIESWRIIFEDIAPWRTSFEEQALRVNGDFAWILGIERYQLSDGEEEGEAGEDGHVEAGEGEADESWEGEGEGEEDEDVVDDEASEDDGRRTVAATHVFHRDDSGWKLVHRHASAFEESSESIAEWLAAKAN